MISLALDDQLDGTKVTSPKSRSVDDDSAYRVRGERRCFRMRATEIWCVRGVLRQAGAGGLLDVRPSHRATGTVDRQLVEVENARMAEVADTYSAMLIDGPLEGKTISIPFHAGQAQARLSIPSSTGGKSYVYVVTDHAEYSETSEPGHPVAVAYRYSGAEFA